jgi:glycosyltransferase involved in cell wall biosynthesis
MSNEESVKRRTILVITYAFPPVAYVGVHRTLKYCRYLPAHRWLPVVLTCRPSRGSFTDQNLCRQIPDEIEVHRTADFDPARLMHWLSRLRRRSAPYFGPGEPRESDARATAPGRVLSRLKRSIKALLTQSPDSHIFWLPFALSRGIRVLLTRKVDVIYSTSPPHSSHIAAYLLAMLSGKPYVLDFRDPWHAGDRVSTIQGRVKQVLIRKAARVICVSQGERDELRAEFPDLGEEHFTYITNGYDPADAVSENRVRARSSRLSLIHAGTIYSGIAGEFFQALRQMVAHDPHVAQSMTVHLVGDIAAEYASALAELQTAGLVKVHGMQPHGTTLHMLRASDVMLILLGGTFPASHIPSKVFEYLHAGKPILAIATEGELARIVRQSGLGIVVPPRSVASVVDALRTLLLEHAAGRLARSPNQAYIRCFERTTLTERLASVLDGVMQDQPRPSVAP